MTQTLFQLTDDYLKVLQMDEFDQEVIHDTLEAIEGAFEDKADNIAALMRSLQNDEDGLEKEIERMKNRKNSLQNRRLSLREYLHSAMRAIDKPKFKTLKNSFNLQNNPQKVAVTDEKKIFSDYFSEETIRKLDKKKLLEDLKIGKVVPGCHLEQGESLRIR
ncbi:MAG: siphovirus Gp157 family protein [Streptococcaceae bacterium]|nr:siphovirus Gp157 family protein [Streptococcaceae bacterium]MCL2680870.1 siphovirus Gp157 family protein [Streptococcaceae bacterium]MCL2858067.1 siphovirus Gp157 family protein [Streptococcaceae bacterium]